MSPKNSQRSTTGGQHQFATNATAEIQRSQFDRSHGLKTAFNAGLLIPIFCEEVLPGDTMNMRANILARLTTPIFPVMDNLYLDTQFFFVPNRLLWENWEKFQGAQDNPGDSTDFLLPQVETEALGVPEETLFDFMGIPIDQPNTDFAALWGRAYNLIWNEWYRSQDLQDSVVVPIDDGPDTLAQYEILPRGKRHDYFTSCLPAPQKGPAVALPLGSSAPLGGDIDITSDDPLNWQAGQTGTVLPLVREVTTSDIHLFTTGVGDLALDPGQIHSDLSNTESGGVTPFADLSLATAATINSLRLAFQVQRVLERDARGGTRYVESIKSHFNVTSPDFRLQRPEYLGGGTQKVTFNQVAYSAFTSPQIRAGELGAYAVSNGDSHTFQKSFTEHGVILGMISARADLNYQQGLDRMWSRRTRYDFFIPALAHLGEQAVLNKEIYMDGSVNDDLVFGYQERWAEYRYKPSKTTGIMRSTNSLPLDQWHLAQEFSVLPTLGADFIEENPPIDRVVGVPSEPDFIMDAFFQYKCARPMPVRSTPGLIDHF